MMPTEYIKFNKVLAYKIAKRIIEECERIKGELK